MGKHSDGNFNAASNIDPEKTNQTLVAKDGSNILKN